MLRRSRQRITQEKSRTTLPGIVKPYHVIETGSAVHMEIYSDKEPRLCADALR